MKGSTGVMPCNDCSREEDCPPCVNGEDELETVGVGEIRAAGPLTESVSSTHTYSVGGQRVDVWIGTCSCRGQDMECAKVDENWLAWEDKENGERWCVGCYRFGCAANWCRCKCHFHPELIDEDDLGCPPGCTQPFCDCPGNG